MHIVEVNAYKYALLNALLRRRNLNGESVC
jgi:hypothetical protein